jgi:hypothetical protein
MLFICRRTRAGNCENVCAPWILFATELILVQLKGNVVLMKSIVFESFCLKTEQLLQSLIDKNTCCNVRVTETVAASAGEYISEHVTE